MFILLLVLLVVLFYPQVVVDLYLSRILLILRMHYLNVHKRGNFFGYFIASSYYCPFFLALLLIQFPTLSFVAVAMLLVCNAYLLVDPFGSPTLPLLVVVEFCMRYIFGDVWARP